MKKTYTLELTDIELVRVCLAIMRDAERRENEGDKESAKMLRSVDNQLLLQSLGSKI